MGQRSLFALALTVALVLAACAGGTTTTEPAQAPDSIQTQQTNQDVRQASKVEGDAHEHHEEMAEHHEEADDHHGHVGDHHERAAGPLEGAPEITIVATEFSYTPASVTVKLGEPINIVLVNEGKIEHDLEIAAFAFHLHAQPGETVVGGLVPDQEGVFKLDCTVPGHAEAGMTGTMVVE